MARGPYPSTGGNGRPDVFEQNDSALSSGLLGFGPIDPLTGVFHLERSGECFLPGDDGPSTVDGTFAPDGRSFSGTYSVLVIGTPSYPCVRLDGFVQGTLLRGRQTLLGKSLTIKDPSAGTDPSKRKIVGSAREKHSSNTLSGDPTLPDPSGGAILHVFANGATPTAQEFALPQGTTSGGQPFWSGSSTKGFKYGDPRGDQGPVKSVTIKRSGGGSFSMKVVVSGKSGTVDVRPPDPGSDGCVALQLGIYPYAPGDRYSVQFGPESTIRNDDGESFKASRPTAEGYCPDTVTTTTTTAGSTTTTTTLSGSPSGAFLTPSVAPVD
jgi:hypothetical protein